MLDYVNPAMYDILRYMHASDSSDFPKFSDVYMERSIIDGK